MRDLTQYPLTAARIVRLGYDLRLTDHISAAHLASAESGRMAEYELRHYLEQARKAAPTRRRQRA